jgi:hypothetical protein
MRTETEVENKINIYFFMFSEIETINIIAQQNSALISKLIKFFTCFSFQNAINRKIIFYFFNGTQIVTQY